MHADKKLDIAQQQQTGIHLASGQERAAEQRPSARGPGLQQAGSGEGKPRARAETGQQNGVTRAPHDCALPAAMGHSNTLTATGVACRMHLGTQHQGYCLKRIFLQLAALLCAGNFSSCCQQDQGFILVLEAAMRPLTGHGCLQSQSLSLKDTPQDALTTAGREQGWAQGSASQLQPRTLRQSPWQSHPRSGHPCLGSHVRGCLGA